MVELAEPYQLPLNKVFRGIEANVDLEFKWFSLHEVHHIDMKPGFLRAGLLDLPAETKYIKVSEIAA